MNFRTTFGLLSLLTTAVVSGWALGRAFSSSSSTQGGLKVSAQPNELMRTAPPTPAQTWVREIGKENKQDWAARLEEIDNIFEKEGYDTREAAKLWIFGLWIAANLNDAASYVAALEGQKKDMLGAMFGRALGTVAPEQATNFLAGPWGKQLGKYLSQAVMHAMAAAHPAYFLDQLKTRADATHFSSQWTIAVFHLASTDPARAASEWTIADGSKTDTRLAAIILQQWIAHDKSAAQAWVQSADGKMQPSLQEAWLNALAKTDPVGAVAEMRASKGRLNPDFLAEIAHTDGCKAIELFLSVADSKGKLLESIGPAARALPAEPGAFVSTIKEIAARAKPEISGRLALELFKEQEKHWTLQEKVTAYQAALTTPAEFLPKREIASRIGDLCATDTALGQPLLELLPADARSTAAIAACSKLGWGNERWTGYFIQITPTDMPSILNEIPPLEALTLVATLTGSEYAGVQQAFAQNWAQHDPQAAGNWALKQPNPDATQGTVSAWAEYDEAAASSWVASLQQVQKRDGGAAGLVTVIAKTDPEAAWQWAAAIQDPKLAANAFTTISTAWRDAPPAFQSALKAAQQRNLTHP